MKSPIVNYHKHTCFLKSCYLFCLLFIISSCLGKSSNQTEKKQNHQIENENQSINNPLKEATDDSIQIFINSLDIRLVLIDSVFRGSPDKIILEIENNSDNMILTGNMFNIKRLEFGYWDDIQGMEKIIWPEEGYFINPKTKFNFIKNLDYLGISLAEGRYKLEKNISIVDTKEKNGKYSFFGERTLSAEFIVK